MRFLSMFILLLIATISTSFTVYFIGDSTMADYDPAVYETQRGWGQQFKSFIVGDMDFVNAARNGRSTRSFYLGADSLWATVRNNLTNGDYVFIQFAHNDEALGGISDPSPTGKATAPWDDYQEFLRNYVNETRANGATPILITPIVRNYFVNDTIKPSGRHNLGTNDSTLNYVRAMKAVARELTVPVIDHTELTRNLAESYGPTESKSIIYLSVDDTHLSSTGATLYAQLAVQEMLSQGILTGYLNESPNLIVTPTTADFGNSYIGAFSSSKISVSGLSLSPASGNLAVVAPASFSLGLSSTGVFSDTLYVPYTDGNLSPTDIYVHFEPSEEREYSDSLRIAYGSSDSTSVYVSGTGLSMGGGVTAMVEYPMVSDPYVVVDGPVSAADEALVGLTVGSYKTLATWPDGAPSTIAQRTIDASLSWPSEIDINTGRYVEFAVTPQSGTELTVDSIGYYAGADGGSSLKYRVLYSKNANFSNPVVLDESLTNLSGVMTASSFTPILSISESEGFYLRFYPWYTSIATGKYLCLSNVVIKLRVSPSTDLSEENLEKQTVVYPNPSKDGIFKVKNQKGASADVYNQTGLLIKRFSIESNLESIDLSDCPQGIYYLKVNSNNNQKGLVLIKAD